MSEPKPSPTTASVESLGADAGTRAILAGLGVAVNSPKALISEWRLRAVVRGGWGAQRGRELRHRGGVAPAEPPDPRGALGMPIVGFPPSGGGRTDVRRRAAEASGAA